tara:strand:- start:3033 stop:3263 length:231 start_codon:yes stop_codon:yes gene_type:complete
MSEELPDFEIEEEATADVVELPPAIEKLQAKQARLRQEISKYQAQINEIVERHETAQMAFAQCSLLIQAQEHGGEH